MHVIIITRYALVISHVKAMAEEANNIIATQLVALHILESIIRSLLRFLVG